MAKHLISSVAFYVDVKRIIIGLCFICDQFYGSSPKQMNFLSFENNFKIPFGELDNVEGIQISYVVKGEIVIRYPQGKGDRRDGCEYKVVGVRT